MPLFLGGKKKQQPVRGVERLLVLLEPLALITYNTLRFITGFPYYYVHRAAYAVQPATNLHPRKNMLLI